MVRQQPRGKRDAPADAEDVDVYEVLIKAGRGLLKSLPKSKDALKSLLKVRGHPAAPPRHPPLAQRLSCAAGRPARRASARR